MDGPQPGAAQPALDSGRAWGVVAAAFVALFTAFGVAYSYGVFLEPLRADLGAGRAAAAGVFSLTSLIWFGLGSVTGAAADRFGPRRVLVAGAVSLGAGLIATAQARSLELAFVAYGVGVGIGVACAYVPMVALVGAWFDRRRTLALGVAVAGIGLGTLVAPPASALLLEAVGWRDAFRVLGAAAVVVLLGAAAAVRPAPRARHPIGARVTEALREPDYRWLYLAGCLTSVALFVPFVHLPGYAREQGLSPVSGAALIGVIGMASIAGRLALGALAATIGLVSTYRACFAVMASSFAVWWVAGDTVWLLAAFAAVLGVGYGGFVALTPAVVATRFGVARLGSLLGVLYTGVGVGAAIGPPLAGAVIDASGHRPAIAGALAFAAAGCVALAPVSTRAHAEVAAAVTPGRTG